MTFFLAWIVFPLALGALSLGCGLLLERIAGDRLPGPLLVPAGLTLLIVVATFTTLSDATAELTVPAIVVLAVAGAAWAGLRGWRPEPDWWAVAAAVAVFCAYAAPVVLSGEATFAGYRSLDDTATWFGMTDQVMENGRDLSALEPSSYSKAMRDYIGTGAPVGANLPLGVGAKVVQEDVAWVFQPYLAFLGALLALGLYRLAAALTRARPLRAAIAFVAAQPALLYAYALWGGFKEMAAAVLIVVIACLAESILERGLRLRAMVPLAVATGALVSVLTVAGLAWVAGLFVLGIAIGVRLYGRKLARAAVVLVPAALILAIPALATANKYFREANSTVVFTDQDEIGQLLRPLRPIQIFGIWPSGDFRVDPPQRVVTYVLIALVIAAAAAGVLWIVRRRAWGVLLYGGTLILGGLAITSRGSPWVDGKALATVSPALVLVALAAAAWLLDARSRVLAAAVVATVAGGVLWSNAMAYHAAAVAPRDQLTELEKIGELFAGAGPALMTEFNPYGTRHFLRKLDPEATTENLRVRPIPLATGETFYGFGYYDTDAYKLDTLLVYRTIVLRQSPSQSRPSAVYSRVFTGRYYEVWQRPDEHERVLKHLSLGNRVQPGGVPDCAAVVKLAASLPPGGRLATVERATLVELELARVKPENWRVDDETGAMYPSGAGTIAGDLTMESTAHYGFWINGSFRDRLRLFVDGKQLADVRNRLDGSGQYTHLGSTELRAGEHNVELRYDAPDLRPGSSGDQFRFGNLVFGPLVDVATVAHARPEQARDLCGRNLDWVEALAP